MMKKVCNRYHLKNVVKLFTIRDWSLLDVRWVVNVLPSASCPYSSCHVLLRVSWFEKGFQYIRFYNINVFILAFFECQWHTLLSCSCFNRMYKTNTQHKNNVGKFIFDPKSCGISRKYRKAIVNALVSCSKLFVGKTDFEPYVNKFPVRRRSTKRVRKKETNGYHISKVQASLHTHTRKRTSAHTHTPPTEHLVQHQNKRGAGGRLSYAVWK